VDSFTETHNGLVLEATYDLAGGPFQGDYDFHKLEGGARLYWRPWRRLQVAARLGAGVILPFGQTPGAPVNFKFYLGGANSLRGWGARRLSPQLFECEGGGTDCRGIPVGGLSMIQGSLELRLRTFGDLSLVGFIDMGDVQAEDLTYTPQEWNYAAGPGLRYNSPLGVFRLDVGFRLNEPGVYPNEPGWAAYFGVGETF
jgi:outer membrane translocation and assembly module TamA